MNNSSNTGKRGTIPCIKFIITVHNNNHNVATIRQGIFGEIKFCGSPKFTKICNFYRIKFACNTFTL